MFDHPIFSIFAGNRRWQPDVLPTYGEKNIARLSDRC